MDYSTFSRPKLVANIVGGVVSGILLIYGIYESIADDAANFSWPIFLFLALNCTFRGFSYARLNRMKKSIADEALFVREERRQGLIITIFSNATALLCLLALLLHSIIVKSPSASMWFFAFCAICFGIILIQSIKNLRRFDNL